MPYGPVVGYIITMASSTTLSSALDLQKSWRAISLCIPSMPSSTDVALRIASGVSGSFYFVHDTLSRDLMFVSPQPEVPCAINLPVTGFRYLKIELSTQVQREVTFELICAD